MEINFVFYKKLNDVLVVHEMVKSIGTSPQLTVLIWHTVKFGFVLVVWGFMVHRLHFQILFTKQKGLTNSEDQAKSLTGSAQFTVLTTILWI